MRLIDADELKETLAKMKIIDEDVVKRNSIHEELVYLLKKVDAVLAEKIDDLPTIEAVPVVHGEWIFTETFADITFYKCSICSNDIGVDPFFDDKVSNFCPNCGAKMDGKAD
jgi:DNA-directed RNA polymerase subunit RPC12/RpoP